MTLSDDLRARRGDPDDPWDQEAARREYKRSAGRTDRARADEHKRARAAGRAGGGRAEFEDDPELVDSFDAGARDRSGGGRPASGRRPSTPRWSPPKPAADFVSDGSGFLLGLIGYALVLNYIRGGPAAVRGWFAAKFMNKPYQPSTPLAPTTPAAPDFGRPPSTPSGIYTQFGGGGVTR